MNNVIVKKVAVLGAGVMGAQIAAHCINAKVPVILFDLASKDGPKNKIVLGAIENLKKLNPAPLGDTNWRFAFDHFRSVAGGVHQAGETEIGTELGAMFFRDQQASLELYKALMDKEWAAGITRPIIHGFAYQPPGSAWPGRDQFTGVVAQSWNQTNFPQWAMFRALNDYWARGNHVLTRGHPRTDVAVYRDGFLTSAATYQALGTRAGGEACSSVLAARTSEAVPLWHLEAA